MPSLVTERIESVKAGIVGAGAFTIAELTIMLVRSWIVIPVLTTIPSEMIIGWMWLVQLAIGAISGFLFGVTYRYIIRGDRNSHLNDGAVLAFGLVRGLALVEDLASFELLSALFLTISSVVCFTVARLVLDLAIARKFIKPFV